MNFRWQAHLDTSMWKLLSWIVSCGTWEDWDVPWCWILVSVLNETQMWVEGCECCFCEPRLQYKYSENTNTLHIMWCVFSSLRWMRLRIISCRGANTPSTLLRRNRCFLFCSYFYCCHLHPFVPTILFTASSAVGPYQDWLERQSWTTSGPAHILLKIGELVFQT